jgi:hypothetical protein
MRSREPAILPPAKQRYDVSKPYMGVARWGADVGAA